MARNRRRKAVFLVEDDKLQVLGPFYFLSDFTMVHMKRTIATLNKRRQENP
jgi:hypothetical protein